MFFKCLSIDEIAYEWGLAHAPNLICVFTMQIACLVCIISISFETDEWVGYPSTSLHIYIGMIKSYTEHWWAGI